MKPFESFLAPRLNEFLAYRRQLGYKTAGFKSHLHIFDRYLKQTALKETVLEPMFFLEMRAKLRLQPSSINNIVSAACAFFKFMVRQGYYEQNPVGDIPYLKENTVVPFIFSPEQTDQLLAAVCKSVHQTAGLFLTDLAI